MVRKNTPLVLPSRPSAVSVGEEDAGDTCTTLAGAVTEVRMGIETEEMMPPMMTGTFFTSHQLLGDVDRDIALALGVAGVGDELAAVDAAGIVDVAQRHLDRLGAGLAVGAGRASQLHDDADGDVAIGGAGRAAHDDHAATAADKMQAKLPHTNLPGCCSSGTLHAFLFRHPGFLEVAPDHAAGSGGLAGE